MARMFRSASIVAILIAAVSVAEAAPAKKRAKRHALTARGHKHVMLERHVAARRGRASLTE
jgi:hypothetical protein